jgi:hypothetical protein
VHRDLKKLVEPTPKFRLFRQDLADNCPNWNPKRLIDHGLLTKFQGLRKGVTGLEQDG